MEVWDSWIFSLPLKSVLARYCLICLPEAGLDDRLINLLIPIDLYLQASAMEESNRTFILFLWRVTLGEKLPYRNKFIFQEHKQRFEIVFQTLIRVHPVPFRN